MKKVLVFSGTTEGRELAEILSKAGIYCEVCVATEYGKEVMEPRKRIQIHQGRMDEAAMQALMQEQQFFAVVDATHPYAQEVSKNIRNSAGKTALPYLRLKRDTRTEWERAEGMGEIFCVDSPAACIGHLKKISGNILLTTGSKDLACYAAEEELRRRLYVRVLPGIESIALCQEQGIPGKQIIAMQGPFSTELNEALLRQYQISVLVTKESGHTGGFLEKVEAAKRVGIPVLVIENPEVTEGNTWEEVLLKISRLSGVPLAAIQGENVPSEETEKSGVSLAEIRESRNLEIRKGREGLRMTLAGLGMGDTRLFTGETEAAIREADYLIGAKRLLEAIPEEWNRNAIRKDSYLASEIIPYIETIGEQKKTAKIVLLFSGDTGFYSGAEGIQRALREAAAKGRIHGDIRICPGISSIAYLAAKAGKSWQDAKIVSIHGRNANLPEILRTEPKIFLLVSGVADMQKLGRGLLDEKMEQVQITAGYQLSYPEEQILRLTPEQCSGLKKEGLYSCILENPAAKGKVLTPGIADESFVRDRVPMTKEEIRELSICKLGLYRDAVLYDVGSGTGSVAVEAARLSDSIQVYAMEKKELALSLIGKNCDKFGVHNVHIIAGEAPECFVDLPAPTHAFIGGSSGKLREILECLYHKNPAMRVVLNAISLETVAEMTELLKEFPISSEEIIQLQVSRARVRGAYHLMQAENPIYVISFCFGVTEKEGNT